MNKRLFTIVVLLSGLLVISPLNGAVEGNTNINGELNDVDQMYVDSGSIELLKSDEAIESNIEEQNEDEKINTVVEDRNSYSSYQKNSADVQVTKDKFDKESISNGDSSIEKNKNDVISSENELLESDIKNYALTKEEALSQISERNNEITYSYMGDENDFSVLKEKGYEGYVYLPNVNTDMGVFIDKNTKEKYYFHPSGYMDIYE